jgi:hypothetical protein
VAQVVALVVALEAPAPSAYTVASRASDMEMEQWWPIVCAIGVPYPLPATRTMGSLELRFDATTIELKDARTGLRTTLDVGPLSKGGAVTVHQHEDVYSVHMWPRFEARPRIIYNVGPSQASTSVTNLRVHRAALYRFTWLALPVIGLVLLLAALARLRRAAPWYGAGGLGKWEQGFGRSGQIDVTVGAPLLVPNVVEGPLIYRRRGRNDGGAYRSMDDVEHMSGARESLRAPYAADVRSATLLGLVALGLALTSAFRQSSVIHPSQLTAMPREVLMLPTVYDALERDYFEHGGAKPASTPQYGTTSFGPPAASKSEKSGELDRAAAAAAISSVDLRRCVARGAPRGTGHVMVTFAPSGKATSVVVDKGPVRGSPGGDCVAKAFAPITVPAFSGEEVTVGKAFQID